jgi:hypothetical protein
MTTSDLQKCLGCAAGTANKWADLYSQQSNHPVLRNASGHRVFDAQQIEVIAQAFRLKSVTELTCNEAIRQTLRAHNMLRSDVASASTKTVSPVPTRTTLPLSEPNVQPNVRSLIENSTPIPPKRPQHPISWAITRLLKLIVNCLKLMFSLEAHPMWKRLDKTTQHHLAVKFGNFFCATLLVVGALLFLAIVMILWNFATTQFGLAIPLPISFTLIVFMGGWLSCAMHFLIILPMRGENSQQL